MTLMLPVRLALLMLLMFVPAYLLAKPVVYNLEPAKSNVGFEFTLNDTKTKGSMPLRDAQIMIDIASLGRSTVDVSVDVTGARTGNFFITQILKSPNMLDAQRYDTIRFVSTRIRPGGDGRLSDGALIDGQLSMHGVTKQVTLNVGLFHQWGTGSADFSRLSFRITGQINRSDFGVLGYRDLVKDIVFLNIVVRVRRGE